MSSKPALPKKNTGFYPERSPRLKSQLETFLHDYPGYLFTRLGPSFKRLSTIVEDVKKLRPQLSSSDKAQLKSVTAELRKKILREGISHENTAQTFALVQEFAERTLNIRHYDVQLIGGYALLNGMVAEMETGEGKTLTATLPACTAALAGIPVHIITVNEYLAERDAAWMKPVYDAMGLSVGFIRHDMSPAERSRVYLQDVVYCTNKEIVFDYLKDHLSLKKKPGHIAYPLQRLYGSSGTLKDLILRGLCYAIVDEADSVLIDEARTPLIISGAGDSNFEEQTYGQALAFARQLSSNEHFRSEKAAKNIELTEAGRDFLAALAKPAGGFWVSARRREAMVCMALVALYHFQRDKDYLIKDGKIEIIDEYTGRRMADRSWEKGLHQLIECKENCAITTQRETLARISYQRFFRRYHMLAGMTGTAREVARELWSVYGLKFIRIPTNKPLIRQGLPEIFFNTEKEKLAAVVKRVKDLNATGKPVLIGTPTVGVSEKISRLLCENGLEHRVLNARQDKEEALIIARAGNIGEITVATNMAGRGTDIQLGPEVRELGGLQVIATEVHSARRIDRQLYGRCGRQGDPGTYETYISLEDEVFQPYKLSVA
ncbi:MAG: preprotein translocase subunit SecA, partial [Desulfobulbales bacterium]|nr:preprotein translocase subunit SecA [Desulfobulbales bacterium]